MATDTQASDIDALLSDLEVYEDSPLTRSLAWDVPFDDDFYDRLENGRFNKQIFRYLFDVLIRPNVPNTMFWYSTQQEGELEPGQIAYRLKLQRISLDSQNNCWTIQEFTGGSNVINEYRLRTTYGRQSKDADEILKGVPTWKMQLHVHQASLQEVVFSQHRRVESRQETPTAQDDLVPSECAIVFSMLLDLVTGTFEPHTKDMEDGPALRLEILQMLVKAHKDSIEAENLASGINLNCENEFGTSTDELKGKRKLSMQERLDGKKVKTG